MSDIPVVGLGFHLEDLPVGRKFRTIGRTVTEADITAFVGVTGMVEVLFTNLEHLRHESAFEGKRLVPAALVYSFAEGLVMQSTLQGTGMAFLSMEFTVQKPTFAGDTLHVECEVLESRRTSKGDRGIVKTMNRVVNQEGAVVITYSPTRMIKAKS
ncbi:MaoC/PaaZ C-terminal domain-containing protein [Aquibium sp. LZ166]|uniref:MaoC/PaaZ C-terminal domain-containing protein n=1 Tax=Aquibium pacificus TaxID=3153579 RepID=A0ABV3SKJ4_9HYPH